MENTDPEATTEEQIPENASAAAEEQIPAVEQKTAEGPKFDRSKLSSEDRKAILAGNGDKVFKAQSEKSDGEKPQESQAKKEAPPEETKDKESGMPKLRYTPEDEKELEYLTLRREGKSVSEAYKQAYGDTPPGSEAAPEKKAEEPKVEEKDPTVEIKATLKDAKAELKELETELSDAQDAEDVKEATELTRKIMAKEQEVKDLTGQVTKFEEDAQAAVAKAHNDKVSESADRAYEKYPVLEQDDSPERAEFIKYYQDRAEEPDYEAIFASPRWPELMAREFADVKGIQAGETPAKQVTTPATEQKGPTQKQEPTAVKPPVQRHSQSAAKTLTTGDDEQAGSFQVDRNSYRSDRKDMSLEDKKKLLAGAPIR